VESWGRYARQVPVPCILTNRAVLPPLRAGAPAVVKENNFGALRLNALGRWCAVLVWIREDVPLTVFAVAVVRACTGKLGDSLVI
jgi:hypothetical protein